VICAAALLGPSSAWALSCDEIISMVQVNVPTDIIVMTMKDSGDQFTPDEVKCLTSKGAPAAVVTQAKTQMSSGPTEASVPSKSTKTATKAAPADEEAPPKGNALDEDEDVLGARTSKKTTEDLPEQGGGADPDKIKEAIKLFQAKKPLTASVMLFELLQEGAYPEHETKIKYYLARCLQELEMYHSAQVYYLDVVKKGPSNQYFPYALPQMVKIARFTGDDSDLQRIVAKIPPESFPRDAKNHLNYLLGVKHFEDEDLNKAGKYFGQVSSKSPLYLRSEYFRGVIYNEQGKLKSAVRSFRDVYRQEVEVYNDPRYLREVEELKDLSLMNVARIYYAIENYDEASKYYSLVSRDSSYWPEALFEHAWSNFMKNNLNDTLGQVLTVQSPYFVEDEWNPEATILRALTFFNLCDYKEVEKLLLTFEDSHRPMQNEMRDFVKSYSTEETKKLSDEAWDRYFSKEGNTKTVLPKSLFNRILRNKDLEGIVRHMDLMEQELALIDQQKPRWRDGLGASLRKQIEEDNVKYKKRAGILLLKEMARQTNKVADLITQSEIIRFEVVDAQRLDYQYKAQTGDVDEALKSVDLDFATAVQYIYWPFNGEFWQDELGYYHYTERSSCNKN
jgi:tetratricopeptide (TPR) repeat protein